MTRDCLVEERNLHSVGCIFELEPHQQWVQCFEHREESHYSACETMAHCLEAGTSGSAQDMVEELQPLVEGSRWGRAAERPANVQLATLLVHVQLLGEQLERMNPCLHSLVRS